jgi:hypothetical protein
VKLGFTGTHQGMTDRQRWAFRMLLGTLGVSELHHGDCVGADEQADEDVKKLMVVDVYAHPPSDSKLRAYCKPPTIVMPPKPYLMRNKDIVKAGVDGLVATPKDFVKPKSLRGQGTWTTIGYAEKAKRQIWIVWPDGTVAVR